MPFIQHVNKSEQEFSNLWGNFYENVGDKLVNRVDTSDPVEYLEAVGVDSNFVSVLQVPKAYDPEKLLNKYDDKVMSYSAVYNHQPGPSSPMNGILVNLQLDKEVVIQVWVQPRSNAAEDDFYMSATPSVYGKHAGMEVNNFIKSNKKNELDKKKDETSAPGFGGAHF